MFYNYFQLFGLLMVKTGKQDKSYYIRLIVIFFYIFEDSIKKTMQ